MQLNDRKYILLMEMGFSPKVNVLPEPHKGVILLRELQSATGEELDALLPSVLDRAFKGEL